MEDLREFHQLAKSIIKNSKGEVLVNCPPQRICCRGQGTKEQGAATLQQKAVIFTESRRTQEYLFRVLEHTEFRGQDHGVQRNQYGPQVEEDLSGIGLKRHDGTDHVSGSPTRICAQRWWNISEMKPPL